MTDLNEKNNILPSANDASQQLYKPENFNILFVDDEPFIIFALKRGLMEEPFKQFFANSAHDALEILDQTPIHILVTDLKMPIMGGVELLRVVEQKYPEIVKIVFSGYAQLPQLLSTVNHANIFRFISKPFDLEKDMKKSLNDAMAYYQIKSLDGALRDELRLGSHHDAILERREAHKLVERKADIQKIIAILSRMTAIERLRLSKVSEGTNALKELVNEIEHMHHLVEGYLGLLPETPKLFMFDDFCNQIEKQLKTSEKIISQMLGQNFTVALKAESHTEPNESSFILDLDLIVFLLVTLIRDYFLPVSKFEMTLFIENLPQSDHFRMTITADDLNKTVSVNPFRVETLTSFYMLLFETYGGEAIFSEGDSLQVCIQFPKHPKEDIRP